MYEESTQKWKTSIFTLNGGERKNDRSKKCVLALAILWILDIFSEAKSREITSYLVKGGKEILGNLNATLTYADNVLLAIRKKESIHEM